jgi:beta-lactamase superfamily II metal-dependent hydrolase
MRVVPKAAMRVLK